MAVTVISTNQNLVASKIVQDTDADSTAQDNTTGAVGTLYSVEVVNTLNTNYVYFKMADTVTATGGTTAADLVFACSGSTTTNYVMTEGVEFINGFSHWCVTGSAEANVTNPAAAVTVRYVVV